MRPLPTPHLYKSLLAALLLMTACQRRRIGSLVSATALAMSACVYQPVRPTPAAFQRYVGVFEEACRTQVNIPIYYDDLAAIDSGEGWVGICVKDLNGRRIYVDRGWWQRATELSREQLIMHELGHCVLDKEHRDGYTAGCPVSLMHPHHSADRCYENNKEYYLEELCTED